jgi:hypothetical protein
MKSYNFKKVYMIYLQAISGSGTVSTTAVDQITLLRSGADTSTTAAESGATALGLALVVLKDEHVIGTRLRSEKGFVGGSVAPLRQSVFGCLAKTIVRSDGLVVRSCRSSIGGGKVVYKTLVNHTKFVVGIVGKSGKHQDVCQQEKAEHDQDECDTRIHFFYLLGMKLSLLGG